MKLNTTLLAVLAASVFSFAHADDSHPGTQSQVLLKTTHSWDGVTYPAYPAGQPEITVLKIKIPAHSKLPWHQHPAINAAYVVSGTLFVQSREGDLLKKLSPGDVLPEMVNRSHRGYTEDEPVELVVFYAGTESKPVTVLDK